MHTRSGDGEMQYEEFAKLWGGSSTGRGDEAHNEGGDDATAAASESRHEDQHVEGGSSSSFSNAHSGTSSFRTRRQGLARSMSRRYRDSKDGLLAVGRAAFSHGGARADEFAQLQSASLLHQLSLEQEAHAEQMRVQVYDREDEDLDFETRLGLAMINHPRALAALASKGTQRLGVEDLVQIFGKGGDGKGKRDDELTKIDFRQAVRSPDKFNVVAKNSEIDNMFKTFDDDGGGTLDLKELNKCLVALQDAALAAQAQQAAELQRAELCDERAAMYRAAEATMKAITAEEERNASIIAKHPLEVRAPPHAS